MLLLVLIVALPGTSRAGNEAVNTSLPGFDAVTFSGDFRLRYENTSAYADRPAQSRGVTRGRLGVSYNINDAIELGTRIVTGDADNPRTADVEIGQFAEDLDISLDRLYAKFSRGNMELSGGKMSNPFTTTELVWDGDVNPFGVAAKIDALKWSRTKVSLTAMYSIVDQLLRDDDSNMAGLQVSVESRLADHWHVALRAAYYDYAIGSLSNANAVNIRGNVLAPGGTEYESDFDLVDLIAQIKYTGADPQWPVQLTVDYIRNLGAVVPEDSGYSLDVNAGTVTDPGDWRIHLGYATAETDAVFAAFSNDNTTYPTNYLQQTFAVDYALVEHTYLNLTAYRYKRRDFESANQLGENKFVTRVRLNLYLQF